jgi:SAM-dependent MidA family methyltransferase
MNPLSEIIRREIGQRGVLSFARFMELALYCPVHGYYEAKKDNPGRRGDFYTSVGVGELFGRLLAFQFAEWLNSLRIADSDESRVDCGLRIVEVGAHDGRLAKDILGWLQSHRPELFGQMEYWIVEPSVCRQEWQRETLREFGPRVRWFDSLQSLREGKSCHSSPVTCHLPLRGVIFSNELLDAMPVHRFGLDAKNKKWFEWGVAVDGEKFVWAKIQNPEFRIQNSELDLPSSLLAVLPDDYVVETCPAAESWWREAAGILARGKLMTIDYGLTADELFSSVRPRGTLRAYFRHHLSDDLLANVGEQDLTAHVNFSAIQKAGEAAGLKTESFQTQSQFLTRIAEKIFKNPESFSGWGGKQNREFQTLTHPEHLGRAFRVLIQSK